MTEERKAELKTMANQMEMAANEFYSMAVLIGHHPFIEFCGLMREYVLCCRDAIAQDVDFTECSIHTFRPLPVMTYRADYFAEKLGCIIGRPVEVSPSPTPETTARK